MSEDEAREADEAAGAVPVPRPGTFLPRLFIDLLWIAENTESQLDPALAPRE